MGVLPRIGADASLAQRAYEVLREAILSNQFRPGQILSGENLAAELAISRTPVRAALKRLAFEHLVILNPSKNIVVSDISRADLQDITAARIALEPAARLLAGRMTSAQDRALQKEIARQLAAVNGSDADALIRSEYAFHTMMARFAGNRWIAEMVDTVNLANRRYLSLSENRNRHWEEAVREHRKILQAVEDRDAAEAGKRMQAHIGRTSG